MIKFPVFTHLNLSLEFVKTLFKKCSLTVPVCVKNSRKLKYFSLRNLVYSQLLCNLLLRNKELGELNLSKRLSKENKSLSDDEISLISSHLFESCINDLAKVMFPNLKPLTARKRITELLKFLENYRLINIEKSHNCLYLSFSQDLIQIYLRSSKDFFEISGDLMEFVEKIQSSSELLSVLFFYDQNRKLSLKSLELLADKDHSLYKNEQLQLQYLNQIIEKLTLPELKSFRDFISSLGILTSNLCAFIERGCSHIKNELSKATRLGLLFITSLSQELTTKAKLYLAEHKKYIFKNIKPLQNTQPKLIIPEPETELSAKNLAQAQQQIQQQFTALFNC